MVHLSVISLRILRLRSASEIPIAGLVGFRFLLDSGLHVADAVTEAPLAAARDVDDAAPLRQPSWPDGCGVLPSRDPPTFAGAVS